MSLQVGKSLEVDGHLTFGKRLLSEYNPKFTLAKYVDYFQLKSAIEDIRLLQKKKIKQESLGAHADNAIRCAAIQKEVDANCDKFFDLIKSSYFKIKKMLSTKESECASQIATLKTESEDEVRKLGVGIFPIVYRRVKNISMYRELNLMAFRKILTKFNEHVASKSLDLQEKVRAADSIINDSPISKPFFDVDYMLQEVITIYATVEKIPFEVAEKQLLLFLERDQIHQPRIIPMMECFYYTRSSSHRQFQGDFALKVVPALTCRALGKMLTSVIHCTLTTSDSALFANGEVSVRVGEAVRGDDVYVVQSLRAFHTDTKKRREGTTSTSGSMSTAIVELMLSIQTLSLASASRITAVIPFMSYGDSPMAVAALAEMLVVNGCKQVVTVDLQRDQMEGMFGNKMPIYNIDPTKEFIHYLTKRFAAEENDVSNLVVVSPDGDNVARARLFADALMHHINEELFGVNKKVKGAKAASTAIGRSSLMELFRGASYVNLTRGSMSRAGSHDLGATLDLGSSVPAMLAAGGPEDSIMFVQAGKMPKSNSDGSDLSTPVEASPPNATPQFVVSGGTTPTALPTPVSAAQRFPASPQPSEIPAAVEPRIFVPVATALKQVKKGTAQVDLVGDVDGKTCIVVDTKIDEGVSALSIAKKLKECGAIKVTIVAAHGLFSGDAVSRLVDPAIDEIIITDTIDNYHILRNPAMAVKLRIVSVAPLLARIIQALHSDNSLTKLVDGT